MNASATLSATSPSSFKVVIWPRFLLFYGSFHCLCFALYAFLGKGFAYAGWQPFYISELLLLLAVPAFFAARRARSLLVTPIGAVLLCFVTWQLICMVPYIDIYGIDALRDSVIWGYAVFACAAGALILRLPRSLEITVQRYRRFARLFIFLGPALWLATLYLHDWLPIWPGTAVSVPLIKGGDYDVHLAGVFAFALQGLGASQIWWVLLVLVDGLLGVSSRGGVLALLVSCLFSVFLQPRVGRTVAIVGAGLVLVLLMAAFDIRFTPPGAPRELSIDVLSDGLLSVVKESDRTDLEGTKAWRLAWWRKIWSYTVDGPYFWMGKGYGINLADSDGFQVGTREEPLRSPHNSHLTFLARSGVPGFLLWIVLQAVWGASMLRTYIQAKKSGNRWAGVFAWLLAYWLAFLVESGFDVSLEGADGGHSVLDYIWHRLGLSPAYACKHACRARAVPVRSISESVAIAHNYYQQAGGEDQVFASEAEMLERNGHRVVRFEENNARVAERSPALTAIDAVWNGKSARSLTELIRRENPDLVHFHNTFPLISPAAHYAVHRAGLPVVQTLHNFRLLCPGASLFRNGAVCEDCIRQFSLRPAMLHKCYRGSRPATAAVATMLTVHRAARTWQRKVDVYIALSEFARRKFIQGGLPASRIVVKPNFVSPDPGMGTGSGGYALFAGRLSAEKGIAVLASAWRELADIPLVVAGDGPLNGTKWPAGVNWIGRQSREKVLALMRDARVLIVPSVCYETGPLTILEAFACGLPVIASDLGSMAEMVAHERTGLRFTPGDAADLASKVRWVFEHPEAVDGMRAAARREFEEKYTAERNYEMLTAIYEMAVANFKGAGRAAS